MKAQVGKCSICGGVVLIPINNWRNERLPVPQCNKCNSLSDINEELPMVHQDCFNESQEKNYYDLLIHNSWHGE